MLESPYPGPGSNIVGGLSFFTSFNHLSGESASYAKCLWPDILRSHKESKAHDPPLHNLNSNQEWTTEQTQAAETLKHVDESDDMRAT